jgi:hypothetical protein
MVCVFCNRCHFSVDETSAGGRFIMFDKKLERDFVIGIGGWLLLLVKVAVFAVAVVPAWSESTLR